MIASYSRFSMKFTAAQKFKNYRLVKVDTKEHFKKTTARTIIKESIRSCCFDF